MSQPTQTAITQPTQPTQQTNQSLPPQPNLKPTTKAVFNRSRLSTLQTGMESINQKNSDRLMSLRKIQSAPSPRSPLSNSSDDQDNGGFETYHARRKHGYVGNYDSDGDELLDKMSPPTSPTN